MNVPLILRAADDAPEGVSIVEGREKVGHIRHIENQWVWDIDWFGVGLKMVRKRRAAGSLETTDALFKNYWQWVLRTGAEEYGTGCAPTRHEAILAFNAAWASVGEVGDEAIAPML